MAKLAYLKYTYISIYIDRKFVALKLCRKIITSRITIVKGFKGHLKLIFFFLISNKFLKKNIT